MTRQNRQQNIPEIIPASSACLAKRTRSPKSVWTDADKAALFTMRLAGAKNLAIAEHLSKSAKAVDHQIKLMRIAKRCDGPGRPDRVCASWTAAEKAELVSMCEAGETNSAIADRLGKTEMAVKGKLKHLRMKRTKLPGCDKALEAVLIELHPKFTNAQIGAFTGKTQTWVADQYTRLGMTRDHATVAKRWAANLGHDLPPEVQQLMQLRKRLIRKINAKSQH